MLNERGILYVPDFLANCGGLIHVSREWYGEHGPGEDRADRRRDGPARARDRDRSVPRDSTPIEVAERQALERIAAARA